MKHYIIRTFMLLLAGSTTLISCNRDKEDLDEIFQAAEDQALLEGEFSNVHDNADNQREEDPAVNDMVKTAREFDGRQVRNVNR